MFYFAIPLRSKKSSKNWMQVEKLFNDTIRSIYNQTNKNFKIIVACHDVPRMSVDIDERLEFITVDFPTPSTTNEQMTDKGYKKIYAMKRIKELGAGYVMFLDADDLVSNRLVDFTYSNNDKLGWLIDKGYKYDQASNKIKKTSNFHKLCGSSSILKYTPEDLPDEVKFPGYGEKTIKKHIFQYPHAEVVDVYQNSKNCRINSLPFEGAIYITNNGENHSASNQNFKTKIKKRVKDILSSDRLNKNASKNVYDEFSLN